jgi:hypothetical protein
MTKGIRIFKALALITCISGTSLKAQILTAEDSLNAHLVSKNTATEVSGYGQVSYTRDLRNKTGLANLDRAVLFVGHEFNKKIALFTELEIEDAKVEPAGGIGGEVAMEQAFLKFDLNRNMYLVAGLFTPRIGIINENHLPNTFNGVERPLVEQMVIPATWREIGVGLYGNIPSMAGLNYTIAVVNGLDASGFSMESGIREGRFEGRNASARNLAVTASLLHYYGPFRFQASTYFGGSVGLTDKDADSLHLQTGTFGTPVWLNEIDAQYRGKRLTLKAIACIVSIPDAGKINDAYGHNVASGFGGGYFEAGYSLLKANDKDRQFIVFARYEHIDMNAKVPSNGVKNDAFVQNHVIAGFSYLPIRDIAIKADFQLTKTGDWNPVIPGGAGYDSIGQLVHLGVAYSF